jgi:hypothetical protein
MFRSALERPASWLIGEESGGMPETRASDGTGFVLLVMPDKLWQPSPFGKPIASFLEEQTGVVERGFLHVLQTAHRRQQLVSARSNREGYISWLQTIHEGVHGNADLRLGDRTMEIKDEHVEFAIVQCR